VRGLAINTFTDHGFNASALTSVRSVGGD